MKKRTVETQAKFAEIKFGAHGISLYGVVVRMSQEEIVLRLKTVPKNGQIFIPGTAAELIVMARDTVYLAQTTVARITDADLVLTFQGIPRKLRHRQHTRHVCELPITFRPIHSNGGVTVWRSAVTMNISMGGMCLIVSAAVETPAQIEMLFSLPCTDRASATAVLFAEDNLDLLKQANQERRMQAAERNRPIKVSATVNNRRILADGNASAGISFGKMLLSDQIRLAGFIGEPMLHEMLVPSHR